MKMISRDCNRPIFQGDMMIERVAALPSGVTELKTDIVAHSETGHHHVVERGRVFTRGDAMELFVQAVGGPANAASKRRVEARAKSIVDEAFIDVVHKRSYDTHETLRLLAQPGDVFRIRRQREHTPEGWRRVED